MAYTTINKSTDHFNTLLYVGNGSNAHAITGVGFKPDFVWTKNRDHAADNYQHDIVRGVQNAIRSNNNSATYTYANASSNGCDSIVTLDLTINNVSYHTDYQTHCDTYTWIDGNTYTSDNNTAIFTYPNANSFGCDSIVYLDLTIIQTPQTSAGPDVSSCSLESVLNANTPLGIGTWSCNNNVIIDNINDPASTVTAPNYGSYTFYWLDDNTNGCTSIDSMIVSFFETPIANAGNDTATCPGISLQLNGSGGLTAEWVNTNSLSALNIYNPIASPTSLTNYILKVTDFFDCVAYDTVEVDVFANAVANAGNDIDTCANVPVLLQASGGVSYLWYDSLYLNHNNTANPLSFPEDDQSFIVQVTDSNGCIDTDTVQIFIFLAKIFLDSRLQKIVILILLKIV